MKELVNGQKAKPPAQASTAPAGGVVDEEAHFRIDEIERQQAEFAEAIDPNLIAGVVRGAVAAMHADTESKVSGMMQAQTERLLEAVNKDAALDREVIASIRELIDTLKQPVTRTTTINLPSGPVTMTLHEKRQ